MFNLNSADDWIETADLLSRKRPLNQLSHQTWFPKNFEFLSEEWNYYFFF